MALVSICFNSNDQVDERSMDVATVKHTAYIRLITAPCPYILMPDGVLQKD